MIRDVPVGKEVFTARFCCHLAACGGACCVEGESGAPLTAGEARYLEQIAPQITPLLRAEGAAAIAQYGAAVYGEGWETPLVGESGPCAYAVFEHGTALCGLEKNGFDKPISCRLYPLREERRLAQVFLRYEKWKVCKPARNHLGVSLLDFLRVAIIDRFGQEFYDELLAVRQALFSDDQA
jgi:hypothetical protein